MAVTTPTLVNELPIARSGPFTFNDDDTDATPARELVAAPGAGKAIYLTSVTMSGRTVDVALTLLDAAAVIFGPIQMQADGGANFTKDWKYPLKLTDNQALNVLGTDTVDFTIYGEYFIGQAPIV